MERKTQSWKTEMIVHRDDKHYPDPFLVVEVHDTDCPPAPGGKMYYLWYGVINHTIKREQTVVLTFETDKGTAVSILGGVQISSLT